MRIIKTVLLTLLIPLTTLAADKVITSDIALYRVHDQIIFLSDLIDFRRNLNTLRCFRSHLLLLPAVGLDKAQLNRLPSINKIKRLDEDSRSFIKKVILLQKALAHVKKQGRKYEKKDYRYYENSKCLNGPYKKWPKNIKSFITVELYFQERFKKTKEPRPKYDAKTWDDVKFYLLSVDKKFPHYVFF